MDAQRALLDELMGRNRDGDKPEEDITDFRHSRVCKRYLCGLCPHDLFQNTKMDLGECANLHLPKLRLQFERERLAQPDRDISYDQELERDLIKFISEVEKKIQRAQRRLEEQDGAKAPSLMDFENCKEVLEITAEIQEVMLKAEEAGNEGEVDLSMELMEKVEELKQQKAAAQANAMLVSFRSETAAGVSSGVSAGDEDNPSTSSDGESENSAAKENESTGKSLSKIISENPLASANVNQKLRVCDVCGAFLSIFDSDRRLADHFGGKLHLGYLQIRKKIKEISEVRRERRRQRNGVADELDSPKDGKKESGQKDEPVERRRDRHSRSKSRSKPRYVRVHCELYATGRKQGTYLNRLSIEATGMINRTAQVGNEFATAVEIAAAIVEATDEAAVALEAAVRVEAEAAAQAETEAEEDVAESATGNPAQVPNGSAPCFTFHAFISRQFTPGFYGRRVGKQSRRLLRSASIIHSRGGVFLVAMRYVFRK